MEMIVFAADSRNIRDIAAIEAACFRSPWSESMIEEDISRSLWLCAADPETGKVIACAGARRVLDEADIERVATMPEYRRRGAAGALVTELMRRLHGVDRFFLEVRESNTFARALYEGLGFEVISTRKNYYKNPTEDAVCMRLDVGKQLME